jgi:hypothetical protein
VNRDASNIQRTMLWACCEPLRAMLWACCVQHPNISGPPPSSPMLRPCCDYIPTMLRPVLRATSNNRSSPSPPRHKYNHHMSATSKLNIRNIKIQYLQLLRLGPPPPRRNTQHHISAILKHNMPNIKN